jgi:S1-C subfamily serine protease
MFQQACQTIREAVYGIKCFTPIGGNQVNYSTGTGFMIFPGVIATAAHVIHFEANSNKAIQQTLQVIRAPDVGQNTVPVQLIAEDIDKDIAFLRLENPRSTQSVVLEPNILKMGTSCGSLGFPLSFVSERGFSLVLRFQGAFISAYNKEPLPSGGLWEYYETDSLMYNGSSGCPEFTVDGRVFGMQNKSRINNPSTNPKPTPQNRQQRRQQMRQQQKQQAIKPTQPSPTDRFAISLLVPSTHIIAFARTNGINI